MGPERHIDPRAKAREAAAPRVFVALIGALFLILATTLLWADTATTALDTAPALSRPGADPAPPDLSPHRS
jgi:hypothetical protein